MVCSLWINKGPHNPFSHPASNGEIWSCTRDNCRNQWCLDVAFGVSQENTLKHQQDNSIYGGRYSARVHKEINRHTYTETSKHVNKSPELYMDPLVICHNVCTRNVQHLCYSEQSMCISSFYTQVEKMMDASNQDSSHRLKSQVNYTF